MEDFRKAYGNDSMERRKQSVLKQRRQWILSLFAGVLAAFIGSPMVSLGNDIEPPRKGEQGAILIPKLSDVDPKQTHIYPLKVSLHKITQPFTDCLLNACVLFAYRTIDGEKEVPIEISLTRADSLPSDDVDKEIPVWKAISLDPVTGSPIEVRIEESSCEEKYKAFLGKLPAEKRAEVERGLGPRQDSISFTVTNPWDPNICLRLRIVHTGFVKLH